MKDKQTFHKGDGGPRYTEDPSGDDPVGVYLEDDKDESPFAPLPKKKKKNEKKKVKKALKKEKGTGSHYDGYTYKDYKRDKKKAGTGNHPLNK